MLKLVKYLKEVKWSVLAVLVLLAFQAWCDLSLPQYTADIVDVGIQQGGIADAVPDRMRPSTLEALTLFLDGEDEAALRAAYEADGEGVMVLTAQGNTDRAALADLLGLPMAALYQLEQSQGVTPDQVVNALALLGMYW